MNTKWDYKAEVLRICLKDAGLTQLTTTQLEDILKEQFKEENHREIGGLAYFRNDWLDLEVLYPVEIQEVEEGLHKFSHGDYSGLEKLSLFAEKAVEFHQKHHGENLLLKAINLSFKAAYDKITKSPQDALLTENERKVWVDNYKRIMSHYTVVPIDKHIDQKGFLGWFHVHPSGTGPSPADINFSLDSIPALVFSALPSYQQIGIEIYLLHLGKVELLYQGPLQAAKKQ